MFLYLRDFYAIAIEIVGRYILVGIIIQKPPPTEFASKAKTRFF